MCILHTAVYPAIREELIVKFTASYMFCFVLLPSVERRKHSIDLVFYVLITNV